MSSAAASLDLIDTPVRAAAALDPVRLRILHQLREPASATSVARTLGVPRQRIGYHVRELERHGFLSVVGERRRGNCTEKLLQATARSLVLAPQALGPAGSVPSAAEVRDRFSSEYLVASAARTLGDLAVLREAARVAGKRLPTLTVEGEVRFASFQDQSAFANELAGAVAALIAKYHRPDADGGRTFRVVVSGHPAVTPPRTEPT